METKMFEIRDWGTTISAMGIKIKYDPTLPFRPSRLLWRAGYCPTGEGNILLIHLHTNKACIDQFGWSIKPRTMPVAHQYITNNWDTLEDGALIDVLEILGEGSLGTDL